MSRRIFMLPVLAMWAVACTEGVPTESIDQLPAFSVAVQIQESRITYDPDDQFDPDISGPLIVYSDRRNADADLYLYDLSGPGEVRLTGEGGDELQSAVSGNRIVWTDYGDQSAVIVTCEWNGTDCPVVQVTDGAVVDRRPGVSGNLIVYESDEPGDNYDLFLSDCTADGCERHHLTSGSWHERKAEISGNRIVWEDYRYGQADVFTCLWENGECVEEQVTGSVELEQDVDPSVFGDIIVYGSNRSSIGDIFAYDVSTGIETQLTFGDDYERAPDISGSYVVYESYASGDSNIRLYDLATGTDVALTTDPAEDYLVAVSGNRVVYNTNRNDDQLDIYMVEFTVTEVPEIEDVSDAVDGYVDDGSISNSGIGNALNVFLDQAAAAISAGDSQTACARLTHFVDFVTRKVGKQIDADAAQALIDLVQPLLDEHCGV